MAAAALAKTHPHYAAYYGGLGRALLKWLVALQILPRLAMIGVIAGVAEVLATKFVPMEVRLNAQHEDGVQSQLHWY
jgi:hypothetical protein